MQTILVGTATLNSTTYELRRRTGLLDEGELDWYLDGVRLDGWGGHANEEEAIDELWLSLGQPADEDWYHPAISEPDAPDWDHLTRVGIAALAGMKSGGNR